MLTAVGPEQANGALNVVAVQVRVSARARVVFMAHALRACRALQRCPPAAVPWPCMDDGPAAARARPDRAGYSAGNARLASFAPPSVVCIGDGEDTNGWNHIICHNR
jgi:hypothetical protein